MYPSKTFRGTHAHEIGNAMCETDDSNFQCGMLFLGGVKKPFVSRGVIYQEKLSSSAIYFD